MVARSRRLPSVLKTISQLAEDVDVLVLQELHGYRCGPWAALLLRWLPAGRLADVAGILCSRLEGWWGAEAAVHAPFRDAVVEHAASLGLVHAAFSQPPTKRAGAMDCGVVLLSKQPLAAAGHMVMQGDTIHTPGAVTATIGALQVWGCHLLPRLPPTRWEYRLVRFLNALCRIDADAVGNQNVQHLRAKLHQPALVLGDMNAEVATVAAQCPELRLLSPDENTLCPLEPEGPKCLDHAWGLGLPADTSGSVVRAPGTGLLADRMGADHFPVVVDVPAC